jgi:hypothetical protein
MNDTSTSIFKSSKKATVFVKLLQVNNDLVLLCGVVFLPFMHCRDPVDQG